MVTPRKSLMARENKSIYWYHWQCTWKKHTHMNILLFIHRTSMHLTPVPPAERRICPVVLCIPPTGFTGQQESSNVDCPQSPTALQYATWTVHRHPQHYNTQHQNTSLLWLVAWCNNTQLYHQRRDSHPVSATYFRMFRLFLTTARDYMTAWKGTSWQCCI